MDLLEIKFYLFGGITITTVGSTFTRRSNPDSPASLVEFGYRKLVTISHNIVLLLKNRHASPASSMDGKTRTPTSDSAY